MIYCVGYLDTSGRENSHSKCLKIIVLTVRTNYGEIQKKFANSVVLLHLFGCLCIKRIKAIKTPFKKNCRMAQQALK